MENYDQLVEKLTPKILAAIRAKSKPVESLSVKDNLEGIVSMPAYDTTGQQFKAVLVPLEIFRKVALDAAESANEAVAKIDESILDLTETKEYVKSVVDAESERVANEEERVSNESARISAENIRVKDENDRNINESKRDLRENDRTTNEQIRQNNESDREIAENTRVENESVRVQNEEERIALSEEIRTHQPKIGSKETWEVWNINTKQYEDTNVVARGKNPIIQNKEWYLWNDETLRYEPSGYGINENDFPTLDAKPSSDTLEYVSGNEMRQFQIGQTCRYNNNGIWEVYTLKDISNGVATWSKEPTSVSDLNNDANYITATDANEEVDDVELTYVTETLLDSELEKKQDKLVSGTNVRTINGNSILGNGDIVIKNDNADILNLVYPVGSIYLSVNEVNPSTLFGFGEWEMIKDTFLLGAGDTYQAGSTGGEATHTLTTSEMPSHSHNTYQIANFPNGNVDNRGGYGYTEVANSRTAYGSVVSYTGGSQPHNNMPPYLTVYIWKRIS